MEKAKKQWYTIYNLKRGGMMFSQSLYRKYRPSNFNEVYGQTIAKKS